MHVTALLTGRGNNTLADKNILPLQGKPLLAYPALAAKRSSRISDFYISSDCPKIIAAAGQYGYSPILRPAELASPTAQHKDAIIHALETIDVQGVHPDVVLVMLANSPTIKTEWIDSCIDLLERNPHATAVVPVCRDMDHHPYRAKTLAPDGSLVPFFDFKGKTITTNRQDLPPNFFLCHNFWLIRVKEGVYGSPGLPPWSFMGETVLPYEVDESFDIHDMHDVARAERWLEREGQLKV
ncbi:MAG: hypothetical protein RL173_175 [Fibrobacterota bacterium]|jgi:CMP-N-acetylneuraminic acid synthetase